MLLEADNPVTVFSDGQRIAELEAQHRRKTADTIAELAAPRRADRGRT